MKKLSTTFVMLMFLTITSIAQNYNISFLSNLPYSDVLANIGGWVDSVGTEYALVGWHDGLSIVDVTNPTMPVQVIQVPGPSSEWREVKTYLHYAYVTTEGGGGSSTSGNGLQIIDLQYLPDSVQVSNYQGDSITGTINGIHSLHIDNGYVYLHGCHNTGEIFNGSALICDLNADPLHPQYLGHTPGLGLNGYCHDGFARGNYYYGCHIYVGNVTIYDVTDKTNPVEVAQQDTPNSFTHNCWLSTNSNYLFTTDEVCGSSLAAYDISDLSNIVYLGKIQITPGSNTIIHNTHIVNKNGGDFAVSSWYQDGVVITDVTRPQNMVNVGWYDTYTQGDTCGYAGDWGVYPFLPSGNLVVSDINNGLFVLGPSYNRACYLEGIVTDSVSGLSINNATSLLITTPNISRTTDITGQYRTGYYNPGTYNVQFSKPGYYTKVIGGVSLSASVVTQLNVKLIPVGTGIADEPNSEANITASPNPFNDATVINYNLKDANSNALLVVTDMTGRVVISKQISAREHTVKIGNDLADGFYLVQIKSANETSKALKIVKED